MTMVQHNKQFFLIHIDVDCSHHPLLIAMYFMQRSTFLLGPLSVAGNSRRL